jgi:Xaa-Pro aminopeptidase
VDSADGAGDGGQIAAAAAGEQRVAGEAKAADLVPAQPHIPAEEYAARRAAVRAGLETAGLDALAVFYPARITYLSGFHFIPTERPIALLLDRRLTRLFVPAVEKEHAESTAGVDAVDVYFEYPGQTHPLELLKRRLTGRTAADHDGAWEYWGYRGPRLSDLLERPLADGEMLIESLRRVKSERELACLQLACDWACRAHRRMQDAIAPGRTEMECYGPPRLQTLAEMVAEMPGWRPRGFGNRDGLTASFVAGRKTAMPHGFVRGQHLEAGQTLVSGAGADIEGYLSELERTMFLGEPSREQRDAFAAMLALQTCAIEVLKPGRPAAEVELEVVRLARELGREAELRHHVGHSIGLEGHEAPFLDRGDDAVLEEGMVFTVEPGLYLPELGGFRHSDTVAVTASGARSLTDYPRGLDELIIPTSA